MINANQFESLKKGSAGVDIEKSTARYTRLLRKQIRRKRKKF